MLSNIVSNTLNFELSQTILGLKEAALYIDDMLRENRCLSQKAKCRPIAPTMIQLSISFLGYEGERELNNQQQYEGSITLEKKKFPSTIPKIIHGNGGSVTFYRVQDPVIKNKRIGSFVLKTFSFPEKFEPFPLLIPPLPLHITTLDENFLLPKKKDIIDGPLTIPPLLDGISNFYSKNDPSSTHSNTRFFLVFFFLRPTELESDCSIFEDKLTLLGQKSKTPTPEQNFLREKHQFSSPMKKIPPSAEEKIVIIIDVEDEKVEGEEEKEQQQKILIHNKPKATSLGLKRSSESFLENEEKKLTNRKKIKIQEWANLCFQETVKEMYPVDRPWGTKSGTTDILGLDCEWNNYEVLENGKTENKNQIISIAIINAFGYILFSKIMDPEKLSGRRFVWSGFKCHGIGKKRIEGSKSPKEYFLEVANIVKDRILIGHSVSNDEKTLKETGFILNPKKWVDITMYEEYTHSPEYGRTKRQKKGLEKCCVENKISIPNHDPVKDARAALILYFLVEPEQNPFKVK